MPAGLETPASMSRLPLFTIVRKKSRKKYLAFREIEASSCGATPALPWDPYDAEVTRHITAERSVDDS